MRSIVVIAALVIGACQPQVKPPLDHSGLIALDSRQPEQGEHLSGGVTTVFVKSKDAFSQRPKAIAKNFQLDGAFTSGDHLFRSPQKGFGPLLNNNTCQGCHLNDGRGVLPADQNTPFTSMLVKVGDSRGNPDPVYGDQLQTYALQHFLTNDTSAGLPQANAGLKGKLVGEAFAFIEYEEVEGFYPDGQRYSLRRPVYKFNNLGYGPFTSDIQFSARIAPQVFGAGLLEAIPAEHIQALADGEDADQDGISGRVSWTTNVLNQQQEIGRFAYKAQSPSVLQQVAAAFNGDSGVTSRLFPNESCTAKQTACIEAAAKEPNGADSLDVSDTVLAFIEFYNRTLAVPARRGYDVKNNSWSSDIVRGREHFMQIGCADCHTPRHITGEAKGSVLGQVSMSGLKPDAEPIDVLSNQVIYPYTDLLLHDMGGECKVSREDKQGQTCDQINTKTCLVVQRCTGLADGLPQGDASGSEWKTPPLWGLGLVQVVNPEARFLHDGRARTIEEAVLWHGGESEASQQAYLQLNVQERRDLLAFLHSL